MAIDIMKIHLDSKNRDLTVGNAGTQILIFLFPIFAGSLLQQCYTTIDAMIVGHFAGSDALAAIDSVYNLLRLPTSFFVGLSSGATILISQYFGAKKEQELSRTCHTALLFSFFSGLLLSCLGILTAPLCLSLLEIPSEIYPQTLQYTQIYFSGLAASMVYNIAAGILRAVGDSKTPFYILLVSNVLNLILDILFVAVFRWGVAGVALTTVLSQICSAALTVLLLFHTKQSCRLKRRALRISADSLWDILRLGFPIAIQSALYPLSNLFVQSRINACGTDSIAAWAVCGKMDFIIWSVTDAFCSTLSTFVAQNYGAKQFQRGRKGVRICLLFCFGILAVFCLILYVFPAPIAHIFVSEQEVIQLCVQIMQILAPLYLLCIPGSILPGAIRGTGNTMLPMLLTLICTCSAKVLWILAMTPENASLLQVLFAYPLSWAVTSIAYLVAYSRSLAADRQH